MKQKGFTLVEVLAVIVILGIIVTVVYPTVISTIRNSEEKQEVEKWNLSH